MKVDGLQGDEHYSLFLRYGLYLRRVVKGKVGENFTVEKSKTFQPRVRNHVAVMHLDMMRMILYLLSFTTESCVIVLFFLTIIH